MNLPQLDAAFLKAVVAREELQIDAEHSVCFAPLRLGSQILGSMGISGPVLSRESLEAMGTLIAVAVERAHAIEMVGKTEAAREGERLKSALLDAITHDFRTPLTSMKASVTTLLSAGQARRRPARRTAAHHRRGMRPPEPAGRRSRGNGAAGSGRSEIAAGAVARGRSDGRRRSISAKACWARARFAGLERSGPGRARGLRARQGSAGAPDPERQSVFLAGPAHHHQRGSERTISCSSAWPITGRASTKRNWA